MSYRNIYFSVSAFNSYNDSRQNYGRFIHVYSIKVDEIQYTIETIL